MVFHLATYTSYELEGEEEEEGGEGGRREGRVARGEGRVAGIREAGGGEGGRRREGGRRE